MIMNIELYSHQLEAIEKLGTGSVLCGGVGTGKSRTALGYFYLKSCEASLRINGEGDWKPAKKPKDLYIITTARKRDSLEWDGECIKFMLSKNRDLNPDNICVTIDSWNNIKKYVDIENAFFIFDEQRVVGSGSWVKSFVKIAKRNEWILLSATPGDVWMDYVPVFIANGFYKNRTEFKMRHVVYDPYSKFPKIRKYLEIDHLEKLRSRILVTMDYVKHTVPNIINVEVDYDMELYTIVQKKRKNPFMGMKPIKNVSEYCSLLRRILNTDLSRLDAIKNILENKDKVIVFYNFDYELAILKTLSNIEGLEVAEWNGHAHQQIPSSSKWVYLVQYTAGCEGWNCIETDTIIFYSLNYSYKIMAQASGRIDRLNTPFRDLYFYCLKSNAKLDKDILEAVANKKTFNERGFDDAF